MKPPLLIFNDYFYPAYKAGGPIQSLVNLILQLNNHYEIYVITSAFDLHESTPLTVEMHKWNNVLLPGDVSPIKIFYADPNREIKSVIRKFVKEHNPVAVYINGMFTYRFVILPILLIRQTKLVICPRGMIQNGALAGKFLKKKIYLSLLHYSGLVKNVCWHATSPVEADDARKLFGADAKTLIAGNIPKRPFLRITQPLKEKGKLRLVYLSLITAKKNLLLAMEAVALAGDDVTFDVYGPVKDIKYWERCEIAMRKAGGRIQYKGDVVPDKVQETFSRYDAGFFMTKAENFGHALYECLSTGRPIITSFFTPWQQLDTLNAGWNVNIDNLSEVVNTLCKVRDMDNATFLTYCEGAYLQATQYYNEGYRLLDYKKIFSE